MSECLVANKYVPDNCTYISAKLNQTFQQGEALPAPLIGDKFITCDYQYTLCEYKRENEQKTGWSVKTRHCTKKSYTPLYGEINGFPLRRADYAFKNCMKITSAPEIPKSVETANFMFFKCSKLQNPPVLPPNIQEISGIFAECLSLISAPKIPETVKYMNGGFRHCTQLKEMPEIPRYVQDIDYCFEECTSLTETATLPECKSFTRTFYGCTALKLPPKIPPKTYDISYMFTKSGITKIPEIPEGVVKMEGTFRKCKNLSEIEEIIPDSVENMQGCFAYSSIYNAPEIPVNAKNIMRAFESCHNLSGTIIINTKQQKLKYERMLQNVCSQIYLAGRCKLLEEIASESGAVDVQVLR